MVFITIPAWLRLAAVGLGMIVLALVVPPGIHTIPMVAGALMLLAAGLWSRIWIADMIGARRRTPATPSDAHRSRGATTYE
jgi:hypothetical protein